MVVNEGCRDVRDDEFLTSFISSRYLKISWHYLGTLTLLRDEYAYIKSPSSFSCFIHYRKLLPLGYSGQGVKLTTDPHLEPIT
jgi:hypothetical protein